jgi:cupin fold WbuC family metalloprotein
VDSSLIKSLLMTDLFKERGRAHHNFHDSYAEGCQILLNVISSNSYIRPHRHLIANKKEYLFALEGAFALLEFNDNGDTKKVSYFTSEKYSWKNSNAYGVHVKPSSWHTVISLLPRSTILEVKEGPFNPLYAKEFLNGTPVEKSANAQKYLDYLKSELV